MLNNEKNVNRKRIAERLEQIRTFVTTDTYKNMNDVFKVNKFGGHSHYVTDGGLDVYFSYANADVRCAYVQAEGPVDGKSTSFSIGRFNHDKGTGIVISGMNGVEFKNVGDSEKEAEVRPFRFIDGRTIYLFADGVLEKMASTLDKMYEDIKTIKPIEGVMSEENTDETTPKIEDLTWLRGELLGLCSTTSPVEGDEEKGKVHIK